MTKLNLGSGIYTIRGFDNLDPIYDGWHFEHGLTFYDDESIEGITIAHALMYVPLDEWADVFAEFYRVLEPGGVIRITEDSTADPASERYGGYPGAVTLTSPARVLDSLTVAGFATARSVEPDETLFKDASLIQKLHGPPPKVFHVEGVK